MSLVSKVLVLVVVLVLGLGVWATANGSIINPGTVLDPTVGTPAYQDGCHTFNGDSWNSFGNVGTAAPDERPAYRFQIAHDYRTFTNSTSCVNANPTRPSTTVVAGNKELFAPGRTFWMSGSLYPASPTPRDLPEREVTHRTYDVIFGAPFHNGGGFSILESGEALLITGLDGFGEGNNSIGGCVYTFATFGTELHYLGHWQDWMAEIHLNTIRVGNAIGLTHDGLASQNIPNNDGWIRLWHRQDNRRRWTLGKMIRRAVPKCNHHTNPNFPRNANGNFAPPGAPRGAIGDNILQPGFSYSKTGPQGNTVFYEALYGDNHDLDLVDGLMTAYQGRTKFGTDRADVETP
jgi:hypothetical protein